MTTAAAGCARACSARSVAFLPAASADHPERRVARKDLERLPADRARRAEEGDAARAIVARDAPAGVSGGR